MRFWRKAGGACCCTPSGGTVLFDGITACGAGTCFLVGAIVTVTQATLGFTGTGTTDSNGDCTIAIPCDPAVTFSYSIAKTGFLTKTGTFTISSPACVRTLTGATVGVVSNDPLYFCTGPTLTCKDLIPASLHVTLPTHATFGDLSGTTQTVAYYQNVGSRVHYKSCFAAVGSCLGTSIGIEVRLNNSLICATPTITVTIYENTAAPSCMDANFAAAQLYQATTHTGTAACPVAFTTTNGAVTASIGQPCTFASGLQCTVSE